jgi:hypothetical protein
MSNRQAFMRIKLQVTSTTNLFQFHAHETNIQPQCALKSTLNDLICS